MTRVSAYRALCTIVGVSLLVAGGSLFAMFFQFHMPGGRSEGLFSTMGPYGHYLSAFAGCALLVWACLLLAAARRPQQSSGVGPASAFGLVLCALYRMVAWVVGDYADLASLLRIEAAVFLTLALAFVWLAPPDQGPTVEEAR